MKTKYLLFALPLVALCACSKEGVETNDNKVITISGSTNNDTKIMNLLNGTTFESQWTASDKAKVTEIINEMRTPLEETGHYTPREDQYVFTIASGVGTNTAVFESTTFPYTTFDNGKSYFVAAGGGQSVSDVNSIVYEGKGGSTEILNTEARISIPKNQAVALTAQHRGATFTGYCVYAFINDGKGLKHDDIHFQNVASIITLNLTNNTGSDKAISKITLDSSVRQAENGNGLAGNYIFDVDVENLVPVWRETKWIWSSASTSPNMITLSTTVQDHYAIIANGNTYPFSFVIAGGYDHGTLTWQVYDETETVIATITSTPGKVLQRGYAYTKTATLN